MFKFKKDNNSKPILVGDQVVVSGWKAKVESIYYNAAIAATEIKLDFGIHGKAKVFSHDEGKTFHRLENYN